MTISDPANASFGPAIATLGATTVIAWHDFPAGSAVSRLVTRVFDGDVMGPIVPIAETLTGPKRPAIAATANGFVLAWDAMDASNATVIRTIDLDASGAAIGSPVTVSAAGQSGAMVRVAAHGDDIVFAWTNGSSHFYSRTGSVETIAASDIGTVLVSGGLLNFPRVAVATNGDILIAYRDGAMPNEYEVLLRTRPVGGAFTSAVNVSNSAGLLSDDISLAMESDDTLDVVWVDEAAENVNNFEVTHATRSAGGTLSAPARFGTQGNMTWAPSATVGGSAAWHLGGGAGGDLYLADAGGPPQQLFAGEQGGAVALARAADTSLHFAYVTVPAPRTIRYAVRR